MNFNKELLKKQVYMWLFLYATMLQDTVLTISKPNKKPNHTSLMI